MNLELLFKIKEEMLKDLSRTIENKHFESAEERAAYYDACMESIMKFYIELQNKIHQDAA